MNLIITLKALLITQILMFGWAMQILYSADGLDGLVALVPLGIFVLLGLIDIVLFVIYLVKLSYKKLSLDILVLILVAINILLVIFFKSIFIWAGER